QKKRGDRQRTGSVCGYGSQLARALDQLASCPAQRTLGGRAAHGCAASRQAIPDHHRATVPDGGHGLRSTKRTPDQSLDRARNCRGNDASRDYQAHFPTTRISPVKKRDLKPHLIRYWLTPPADPHREETIVAICQVYHEAPQLAEQGERTVSTDELTGVQALERKHPGLPLAPGKVERREFEYVRHGTRTFILSRDVASGKLVAPHCGPT